MIAALGMYDRPEVAPINDRLWAALRARLGRGPERLTRGVDFWEIWQADDLLLAQTCSLPFRTRLKGKVRLVASPDHHLTGCPPGYYQSVLVARDDDRRSLEELVGGRLAYNDGLSQSGWAAVQGHLAPLGLAPAALLKTGAHGESARAVAEGRADLAGLDAVSWEMMTRYDGFARTLRIVARTNPTPALPYITSLREDPAEIRAALADAVGALDPAERAALHLHGVREVAQTAYFALPVPPMPDS